MNLPNGNRAIVDIRKLRDYALNPSHDPGKHKARVFKAALGLLQTDADWLREELLSAAATSTCYLGTHTSQGQRFVMEIELNRGELTATVRAVWNIPAAGVAPRLITCHVL
jgi:hypothetical protein